MTNEPEQVSPPNDQPQDGPADTPQYREISKVELKKILEEHRKWVESEGKEGEKAKLGKSRLQNANLSSVNLQKASLRYANLQKANLFRANLQEANLFGANLQKANLGYANLQKANLFGASLQKANLFGANLDGATNLTQGQLDQACVDEATKLPEGLKRPKPCPEVNLR